MVNKHRYRYERLAIIAFLGGKCVKCGFSDHRALQIDHVNGNGLQELRAVATSIYYRVIRADQNNNYQLLCANCNWIKRYETNENPHQQLKKTYVLPEIPKLEIEESKFCKKGHPRIPGNIYYHNNYPECKICKSFRDKQSRKLTAFFKLGKGKIK